MARIIAALLASACAGSASIISSRDNGALVVKSSADQRGEVCRFCHKLCPISCFVGTCGINMAYSVRKYEATNQCYSCDPAVSVGVSRDGDYLRCEADESGVSESGGSPYAQQQGVAQGPQGPAVPGNAGLAALKASQQAQIAVAAATRASILADKAAKAATAKYRQVTGVGKDGEGNQIFSAEAQAENAQAASQIRAEEALRVAEAAHTAWKAAMGKYNEQVELLRKQQLITDQAEKTLEAAEATSEEARGQYAQMQAQAKAAMEAAMMNGGSAANKITSQAASEELAGAAMAAHRRLVIAAKEAKAATDKISIASAMAPCADPVSKTVKTGVIGCMSIQQKEEQDKRLATVMNAAQPVRPLIPDAPPPPSTVSFVKAQTIAGLRPEDLYEEPAVPAEGQLEVPSLEQQMTDSLAEKLASNPAAVSDPSLFAVPQVPFSADQVPRDGMETVPNFDLSTMSAIQMSKPKLRKGSR